MSNLFKTSLATAILLSLGPVTALADEGMPILDNINVSGEIRPRYETVDEDNPLSNANAVTNRLVLGAEADLFGTKWLSGFAQMTDVRSTNNNFNSTDNGQSGYSVVADPGQTRLTQSYLDFKMGKTIFRAGRQVVRLDNLRFVGAVNWRQMPQTFDAYALVDNSLDKLDLTLAYVTQVNTVLAGDRGSFKTSTAILNGKYKAMDALAITGYGYLIGSINDTYGIALTGDVPLGGTKLDYRAEYAMQTDASLETSNLGKREADADYINLQLNANMSGFLAGVQYETQSGTNGNDNKTAFITPLATGHAHNGWADRFLLTPAQGLVDLNVMFGYKNKGFGVAKVIYHDFSSDVGSVNYGTEFDLLYKNSIPGVKNLNGMLKAALYSGGDVAVSGNTKNLDVDKTIIWVMLDYKFQ